MKKILLVFITIFPLLTWAEAPVSSFANVVEPLMPAVVNINTVKYVKPKSDTNEPFSGMNPFENFQQFFEHFGLPFQMDEMPTNPKATSLGSGFIIDSKGFIVTNHHVIKGADEITVRLNNNKEYEAKLIGSDAKTDVALLKVEAKEDLPYVQFGDSQKARVGDWVLAIGNPFGLGGTVTAGIVSSKARDIDVNANGIVDDYIQTDAAINVGNSGGPMFNMQGEVIGVNSVMVAMSGGNTGIGFAIPSNTVKKIVQILKEHGKISRGMLGIRMQEITPEIAEGIGLESTKGALVVQVEPGSVAEKAGVKVGDVVVNYNSQPVKNMRKLRILVAETPVNTEVPIQVLRDNKTIDLKAKIIEQEEETKSIDKPKILSSKEIQVNNVIFSNITEALIEKYDLDKQSQGVVVTSNRSSGAWRNLLEGDVIVALNRTKIANITELEKFYNQEKKAEKKNIVFIVKRGNMRLFLALPVDK